MKYASCGLTIQHPWKLKKASLKVCCDIFTCGITKYLQNEMAALKDPSLAYVNNLRPLATLFGECTFHRGGGRTKMANEPSISSG